MYNPNHVPGPSIPWNKGKLVGQKPPLKLKKIWSIRIRLQIAETRLRVENIETLECAADDLSAHSELFDAAMCRLGLMLFPDPVRSGASIRNALKSKARFAPLVFTTPPNNPLMSDPMQILLRHAGKEPPPLGGPGIFALGAPESLQATLEKSGYTEVSSDVVPVRLTLNSVKEALEMMRGAFGNYRAVVADLGEDERNAAWSEVGDYLEQFETNDGWQTELEVVIGSGVV